MKKWVKKEQVNLCKIHSLSFINDFLCSEFAKIIKTYIPTLMKHFGLFSNEWHSRDFYKIWP